MSTEVHEAAPHHLPPFITPPGETDLLNVFIVTSVLVAIVALGILYFRLHALPEQMAHRSQSTQLQLVGVLALLALFTHNNLFWVAALLLAALRMPDFVTPITSIARSVAEIARGLATGPAAARAAAAETAALPPTPTPAEIGRTPATPVPPLQTDPPAHPAEPRPASSTDH